MKRFDSHGRKLNYEVGEIHRQLDMVPDASATGSQYRNGSDFFSQLDRLVAAYREQGRPDAILYVTPAQERLIRSRRFRDQPTPLEYRGHRVVAVE
jgi:hypothetical protein